LYWADVLSRHSDYYVKRYIRQVVGEETRNWNLFWMALKPGDASYRDMVGSMTMSRKKWESNGSFEMWNSQLNALANTEADSNIPESDLLSMLKKAISDGNRDSLYKAFAVYDLQENDDVWNGAHDLICKEVEGRFSDMTNTSLMLRFYTEWTGRELWEIRMALFEMLAGDWNDSFNEYIHDPDGRYEYDQATHLKKFKDYVYDVHVFQGKARLRKYFEYLKPGSPSPGNLDMRWSGQFTGVSWRFAAFNQFGESFVDKNWEDIKMTSKYWKDTLFLYNC
jgi:hypothetical protein